MALGGGTNSVALAIKWVLEGGKLDLVLFADPGAEKPRTYEYVDMFSCWLKNHGCPGVTKVYPNITIVQDCLNRKTLPAKAFGWSTCSHRFKIQPQDKFLNNWKLAKETWKAGNKVIKLIGYHAGEEHRSWDAPFDKKYERKYPLIDWDIDQAGCIEIIKSSGLPLPGKSSCYICPHMHREEVLDLKINYPDLLEKALFIERQSKDTIKSNGIKGLGRTWNWNRFNDAGMPMDDPIFKEDYIGMPCACFDG